MKIGEYLKDRQCFIGVFLIDFILINILLCLFSVNIYLLITIDFILWISNIFLIIFDYYKKNKYYQQIFNNLQALDKKYLILETLNKSEFIEGKLLEEILYMINKDIMEKINCYRDEIDEFSYYIESWIHEVKVPVASLILMCHNHKDKISNKFINQAKRIDAYLDQILYYVRSNSAEKDLLIKENSLQEIVNKVLLKNKDDILENKIEIEMFNDDKKVCTDSKWLEFILNQIINNAIKYKDESKKSIIRFSVSQDKSRTKLLIFDNGIGISKSDLPKVFEKSFTGVNGRNSVNSTGFGLYIVKTMCQKLGHKVTIQSKEKEYTEVILEFGQNDLYKID